MREMKDSGISWVGEIPKEWRCLPIRALFTENRNKNFLGRETKALQFKYGTIVPKKNFDPEENYVAETILNYNIVDRGMIMLNGLNLNFDFVSKRIALVAERGIITSAYMSFYPTDTTIVLSEYANYLLKSYDNCAAFHNMGGGVRKILNFDELKRQYFVLPPLAEQQRIAEFLDRACGKIDGLKADIQAQIDTLEQYKRSVITETVTHGLNPSAPMKDSRISWVGDIPQNWEIKRLKYLFKFCKGLPITKDNLIDQGLPVISYGQIHAKTNNGVDVRSHLLRFVDFSYQTFYPLSQVMRGDFVFADTSEDYEGCGNCVYKRNDSLLFAGYHTIIAHSIVESDNRFFAYLFQTDIWRKQIREKVSGVKVFSITQKTLSNTYLILPPLDEQQEIADYLDNKCAEIERIIADKKSQIETLDGYKKSLIYEYVTGKKEVL